MTMSNDLTTDRNNFEEIDRVIYDSRRLKVGISADDLFVGDVEKDLVPGLEYRHHENDEERDS